MQQKSRKQGPAFYPRHGHIMNEMKSRSFQPKIPPIERGREPHLYGGRSRFAVWSVSPISRWFPPSLFSLPPSLLLITGTNSPI